MGVTISSLYTKLFGKKEIRILMTGIDAAGKTTVLYKLKRNTIVTTIPTIGFNIETIEYKNINFVIVDLNGNVKFRRAWRPYYKTFQAVILVMDSSERERICETQEELEELMTHDDLKDVPVLIMANKHDLPNTMSAIEIADQLKLRTQYMHRVSHIQECSAYSSHGLNEGLEWILNQLSTK